jgi:hypothetical protein
MKREQLSTARGTQTFAGPGIRESAGACDLKQPESGQAAMGIAPESDRSSESQSEQRSGITERTREQARHVGESARDAAREAGEHVRQAAGDTARRVRDQGVSLAAEQKDRAAEELSHFGKALRCAADTLHEEGDDNIADYAEMAADRIDRATGYLRDSDFGRLVGDAEQATRRRPELVYGGMFIAGLALSRFLKASARNRQSAAMQEQRPFTTAQGDGSQFTARSQPEPQVAMRTEPQFSQPAY